MSRFVLLDEMSGSFRMGDGSEPPLKQTSVVVKFAPGLVPVLKHGNQKPEVTYPRCGKGGAERERWKLQ